MRYDLQNEVNDEGIIDRNALEEIIKLLMNSLYGKSIQKTITTKSFYKTHEEHDSYCIKKYNKIVKSKKINDDLYEVILRQNIDKQFSLVQLGVNILSMSKRIMNEVMTLAFDFKIPIYYQDTDLMRIELDRVNSETNELDKDYNLGEPSK